MRTLAWLPAGIFSARAANMAQNNNATIAIDLLIIISPHFLFLFRGHSGPERSPNLIKTPMFCESTAVSGMKADSPSSCA
jgi:hypothetical protein